MYTHEDVSAAREAQAAREAARLAGGWHRRI